MTNIYKISSSDIIDVRNFYHQASEQVWYVLNEKRIRNTIENNKDDAWKIENKRLQDCEKMFAIKSDSGFTDMDIGYLFGLYAITKFYAEGIKSWGEIDREINDLTYKYHSIISSYCTDRSDNSGDNQKTNKQNLKQMNIHKNDWVF